MLLNWLWSTSFFMVNFFHQTPPPPPPKKRGGGDKSFLLMILALSCCAQGPSETPYDGGVFQLAFSVPEQYPLQPPQVRFLTKIFHPNVHFKVSFLVLFGFCWDNLLRVWYPELQQKHKWNLLLVSCFDFVLWHFVLRKSKFCICCWCGRDVATWSFSTR